MKNTLPKKHHSVKVIGNDRLVTQMFQERDYKIIPDYTSQETPDLVCFTGGEDISPSLYGEKSLVGTHTNLSRDKREVAAWNAYSGIPKVGICRG